MEALRGRFIVLGVTGSIAAYKSVELARRLTQAGATVQVVMSRSAAEFVLPLTFQALTYRPVEVEMFQIQDERAAGHIAMGRQADVVVIAPATAHVLARLANGFSDDLIATTVLATDAPIVLAPAMETHMWQNAATRANVATLRVPAGTQLVPIETAEQLRDAVLGLLPNADAVVMAAAVADYRPIETRERKIKKRDAGKELNLRLTENPDILKAIVAARRAGAIVVGFKAETGDATAEAGRMLREKKLDLVVANDVSHPGSAFGSDTDRVTFVSADGVEALPLLAKTEVARRLVAKLAERLAR